MVNVPFSSPVFHASSLAFSRFAYFFSLVLLRGPAYSEKGSLLFFGLRVCRLKEGRMIPSFKNALLV